MSSPSVSPLHFSPGSVVVFEGLDKAGKSTQLDLLKMRTSTEDVLFAHMPSGLTEFSQELYSILENRPPSSSLSRQLSHLASHSDNMQQLVSATSKGTTLILDRWWWSTWAYGWSSGELRKAGLPEAVLLELIKTIWNPISASIVFLFASPHEDDANNISGVAQGYFDLAANHTGNAVVVPENNTQQTHNFIVATLMDAGIIHTE